MHNAQLSSLKVAWVLAFAILMVASVCGFSQGLIVPREVIRPEFKPVELVSQEVNAEIVDGTARVTVQQVFRNPNRWGLEGTYVFPLPKEAVVSNFLLIQDGKEWAAELMEADHSRQIYQDIVRRRKDPALLEYVNQKLFKASIFPIPPGGERQIDLTYSQVLQHRDGLYVWGFPFPSSSKANPDADLRFNVYLETRNELGNVYSPQSQVDLEQEDSHHAQASFEGEFEDVDGPFQVYYSLADKHFGMNLLAHRDGEEGTFLLMISPQRDLEEREITGKDIVFVLDRSGSMGGSKIRQAKDALSYCLENLHDRDRFNIIAFSDAVRMFQNDLVSARDYRRDGLQFVDRVSSGGGTNIHDALHRALAMDWDDSRPRSVIFLTDGLPTIGVTDLEKILDMVDNDNQEHVRLFPFGVGHDVDAIFLDRMAEANRGATEYVEPGENIETAVSSFYNQIQHPVLADPELEFGGVDVDMVYPTDLPDLFAGNQLLILGRYRGDGEHSVILTGEINNRESRVRQVVNFPQEELDNDFVDELWAARRIGFLLEETRLHGENDELKDEVIDLSKTYGIATPYTSFLVTEEEQLVYHPIPHPLMDQNVRPSGVHVEKKSSYHFRGGSTAPCTSLPGNLPQSNHSMSQGMASGAGWSEHDIGMEAIQVSQIVRELKETDSVDKRHDKVKRVAGHTFRKDGEVWVEASFTDTDSTVDIRYGSDAYWELFNQLPELADIFALGDKVILKVGKVYVQIGETGRETIARSEVDGWLKGA